MKNKLWFLIAALIFTSFSKVQADTGSEAATRKEEGSSITVASITLSSTTGTSIWAASRNRPDGVLFNNSAFTIWIGTDSLTYNGVTHPNITNGFPVASSGTFRLDGAMSGAVFATSDTAAGAASVNVRVLSGSVAVAPVIIP